MANRANANGVRSIASGRSTSIQNEMLTKWKEVQLLKKKMSRAKKHEMVLCSE